MQKTYEKLPDIFDQELKEIICREKNIEIAVLLNKTRKGTIVEARQIYFFVLMKIFHISCNSIADVTGFDHATVLHSVKTVKNIYEVNRKFRELIDKILSMIFLIRENMLTAMPLCVPERFERRRPIISIRMALKSTSRIGAKRRVSNAIF